MTYAIYKTHSIPDAILEAESFHATIFLLREYDSIDKSESFLNTKMCIVW